MLNLTCNTHAHKHTVVWQGAFGGMTWKFTSEICCGMQQIFLKLTSVTLPHVYKHKQMLDIGSPSKSFPVCKMCGYCICSKLIMQRETCFSKLCMFSMLSKHQFATNFQHKQLYHCVIISRSTLVFLMQTPNASRVAVICLHTRRRKTVKQ